MTNTQNSDLVHLHKTLFVTSNFFFIWLRGKKRCIKTESPALAGFKKKHFLSGKREQTQTLNLFLVFCCSSTCLIAGFRWNISISAGSKTALKIWVLEIIFNYCSHSPVTGCSRRLYVSSSFKSFFHLSVLRQKLPWKLGPIISGYILSLRYDSAKDWTPIYLTISDELIRDVLLWIPTHCRAKAGRPARTYIQQLCEDTGCCPEDLPRAMNDREEWRERVRDIRAASTIWWWWWSVDTLTIIYVYIYIHIYIRKVFVVIKSLCRFVANQVQYNMESAQYLG